MSDVRTIERAIAAVALALAALAPALFSAYTVDQLLTQVLIFGIVAMSLIYLASYGGMVSLAQTALFGIAGFVFGNMTTVDTKGLTLGYSPWAGIIPAILTAAEVQTRSRQRTTYAVATVSTVLALVLIAHFFVAPLDVLWFAALRRFGV